MDPPIAWPWSAYSMGDYEIGGFWKRAAAARGREALRPTWTLPSNCLFRPRASCAGALLHGHKSDIICRLLIFYINVYINIYIN